MLSKKRKVDSEGRIFQEKWREKYFFWEVGGKPVCLICSQQVAVSKEYNVKRHYETHADKYSQFTGQRRTEKLNELASNLQKQQAAFSKSRETHEGAVKASYIIAWEIAKVSKPFSEGAFIKDKYASVGIQSFYQSLPPEYPIITAFAGKILCMFGTTYLCEQAFSVTNINKSKLRSRLTHGHLNDVMKIVTAQSLSPNVDKLVKSKRLLASTCKM
ncbi:general transcription factor II-I repeat domain-containing protein 2B-like [Neoarius graeffei]|uniref:general transcription factor II-I repeat domain-containing protein 2B-like n=1 Tax=Neoarius graeffei TaxID=443677 RepID=UPI00298CD7DB|nr:general transcription factor II-I repeat domain-containing protein 2B-like [Neoarius graeffei]